MRTALVAFFLFLGNAVLSQDQRQFSFTHYNVNDGLAAYHVNEVIQDEQGFIWIATIDGLQRFDGTRYLTFRNIKNDPSSIPDNQVFQLLLDKANNLWMTFSNGSIGIFDTKKLVYRAARVKTKHPNTLTGQRTLSMDTHGNLLYTLVFSEVLRYNYVTNEFEAENRLFKIPSGLKVISVVQDQFSKKYWFATDSGFAVYNPITKNVSSPRDNKENEPLVDLFLGVHPGQYLIDAKQRLWFHHWPPGSGSPVLYCYDLKNNRIVLDKFDFSPLMKTYVEPYKMLEQKDGTIWLSGLNIFMKYLENENTFQPVYNVYLDEQSIYYKAVHKLYEDREGNIWVCTNNNGLYVFNPAGQLFQSIRHINRVTKAPGSGGVMSFMQLASGDFLVGTWGDGIYRYGSDLKLKPLGIRGLDENLSYSAWNMQRVNKHYIWMAMQPGILVFDEIKNEAKMYQPAIMKGRTNRQIVQDTLGNVWIGSHSLGLFRWVDSLAKDKFEDGFVKYEGVPNTLIEKIEIDSKGFIWVCTGKLGVYKIDPVTANIAEHISSKGLATKRLMSDGVAAALEYNDSLMIFITGGLNIYNRNTNTIRHITSAQGLPSDIVVSIAKDREGFLWLGLFNGLCKMNIFKNTFTYYDRNNGMLNDNFNLAATYQLKDGRMLFGASDDFLVFDPLKVKPPEKTTSVTITDFRIVNNPALVDSLFAEDQIQIEYNKNSIIIGFAALSYNSNNQLTYYYKLDGIDKEWRRANILNQAVYNYLPPGEYTFTVRAANGDGIMGEITSLKIKVKHPFWQTPWFIGIIVLISIIVLYIIDKFRIEKIKENQNTRSTIASSLTKDMSSTLSSINVLSEMAKLKAGTDMERTKEYVGQISENSNRMIEVMDDMVWSINPENDSMPHIIERMRQYANLIQRRSHIDVSFHADKALLTRRLDMDRRHELFLIYKEVLQNVAKHSNTRFAEISLHCVKNRILMEITDHGKGFDTDTVIYGRGLNEIRKRAAALHARLDIFSELNNGTVVKLDIPFVA